MWPDLNCEPAGSLRYDRDATGFVPHRTVYAHGKASLHNHQRQRDDLAE
jgi:hypothetical protein